MGQREGGSGQGGGDTEGAKNRQGLGAGGREPDRQVEGISGEA